MSSSSEQWVPKVHPTTRAVEPEDPLELVATPVQGDPEVMLQCLVQEFVWMGWDAEQLMELFHHPGYSVLNQLLAYYGEEAVRAQVQALVCQLGGFRVHEVIAEDPEPEEDEPELIQLSTRRVADDRDLAD
jgi:hypothetical protein